MSCLDLIRHIGTLLLKLGSVLASRQKHAAIDAISDCRRKPEPQRFQERPGQRSSQYRYRTDQPPADIADSILTNPWTAALVQLDTDRPDLYCNITALTRAGLGSWAPEDATPQHILQESSQADYAAGEHEAGNRSSVDIEARDHADDSSGEHASLMHSSRTAAERNEHSTSSQSHESSPRSRSRSAEDDTSQARTGAEHDSDPIQEKVANAHRLRETDEQGECGAHHSEQCLPSHLTSDAQHSDAQLSHTGAERCNVHQSQPNSSADWTAAFTSKQGKQTKGAGPQGAALRSEGGTDDGHGPAKQRGFSSWLGDFGHLDGPRFSREQGRAWQAHMRSQQDQFVDSAGTPLSNTQVSKCIDLHLLSMAMKVDSQKVHN